MLPDGVATPAKYTGAALEVIVVPLPAAWMETLHCGALTLGDRVAFFFGVEPAVRLVISELQPIGRVSGRGNGRDNRRGENGTKQRLTHDAKLLGKKIALTLRTETSTGFRTNV